MSGAAGPGPRHRDDRNGQIARQILAASSVHAEKGSAKNSRHCGEPTLKIVLDPAAMLPFPKSALRLNILFRTTDLIRATGAPSRGAISIRSKVIDGRSAPNAKENSQ